MEKQRVLMLFSCLNHASDLGETERDPTADAYPTVWGFLHLTFKWVLGDRIAIG